MKAVYEKGDSTMNRIEQALSRLKKLDAQLKRGSITESESDTERLVVLLDLLITTRWQNLPLLDDDWETPQ